MERAARGSLCYALPVVGHAGDVPGPRSQHSPAAGLGSQAGALATQRFPLQYSVVAPWSMGIFFSKTTFPWAKGTYQQVHRFKAFGSVAFSTFR